MRFEPVPTMIRGKVYPSQAAAAAAHGRHHNTVQKAMDEGWLDRVGTGFDTSPVRCRYEGRTYVSLRSAARETGHSERRVRRHAIRLDRPEAAE